MDKAQLVAHLKAYSETYHRDAVSAFIAHNPNLGVFNQGKAEAFATAASWLEVSAV